MKGFIEVHSEGTRVILPVALIAATEKDGKGVIRLEGALYFTDETLDEIIAKIEAAQGETITAELCRTTGANVYYRTADRLPTKEDADSTQMLLASRDLEKWFCIRVNDIENWRFWSPVPKVEVRG